MSPFRNLVTWNKNPEVDWFSEQQRDKQCNDFENPVWRRGVMNGGPMIQAVGRQ